MKLARYEAGLVLEQSRTFVACSALLHVSTQSMPGVVDAQQPHRRRSQERAKVRFVNMLESREEKALFVHDNKDTASVNSGCSEV
ncbi:MAG: hypothetical protein WCD63_06410 [Terrimicrobiaceae bacterium]